MNRMRTRLPAAIPTPCYHNSMSTHLYQALENLSIADKRALGEALIDSAESEASAPLVTEAQRAELRARLTHHRAHPEEAGVTLAQLKAKLVSAAH